MWFSTLFYGGRGGGRRGGQIFEECVRVAEGIEGGGGRGDVVRMGLQEWAWKEVMRAQDVIIYAKQVRAISSGKSHD